MRVKEIDLILDTTLEETPLKEISSILSLKNTTLRVTSIQNNNDRLALSYVVVWNKPDDLKSKMLNSFSLRKKILFLWESPVVNKKMYSKHYLSQFKRVYTWNDDLVDNKKFFKIYYPALKPMLPHLPSFEERKLLTLFLENRQSSHKKELYSASEAFTDYFENHPSSDVEFYALAETLSSPHLNERDAARCETLKNYRFSICYENMKDVKGFISHKIFDCFAAGTVPIYWGASNITDYIPKECFIDPRAFKTIDDLIKYINNIDEQSFQNYQNNIRTFLASDKAQLFSLQMFHVIFLEAIRFP